MTTHSEGPVRDGTGLIAHDPWLGPYAEALRHRYRHYQGMRQRLCEAGGSLADFARRHEYLGLNRGQHEGRAGVWYREWAPAAHALFLTGDFNAWDRASHPLVRDEFGIWSRFLPDDEYAGRLTHGSRVKVHVHSALGPRDRIPAYIRRSVYDEHTHDFCGQHWSPATPYEWRHGAPALEESPRIYEAHVGMAQEAARIGTYREFTQHVLPRIVEARYNVVQLMAIQEHPYYASFGYQVSSFFAPSSRFGTPEELKELIDTAHGYGLRVLLDLVHSHAVQNVHEGLNLFDGTDFQYSHGGPRGHHPAWDSLIFDYSKTEVLALLLSNVRYWLEEFRFDGFRFDGVTSMMYLDHGLGHPFLCYDDYLPPHVDEDAIAYLQLANELTHTLRPDALTIAEDVSGMIGTGRPVDEGGLGFDYRLAMGIPDYWIKLVQDQRDEDWNLGALYGTLANRRPAEKHVSYAESHDQALVGDKTLAFRLMDAAMYFHMLKGDPDMVIERGIALHKMIRLITFALGGEAYLNFMGNEFGHPEWIDFPREGNQWSFKYARRQWGLLDDPLLRYRDLAEFDRAMQQLDRDFHLLAAPGQELIQVHEDNKLLVARRGRLVLAFNWHPVNSYTDLRFGVPEERSYELALNTDEVWFGGHANLRSGEEYPCQHVPWDGKPCSIQVYLPARTAIVLAPRD